MNPLRKLSALTLALALGSACVAAPPAAVETPTAAPTAVPPATAVPAPTATPAPAGPWWGQAVFYEIFVRSFKDSDGDGIGDFNGIAEQLDYLEQLGVKGIWLMPINPSPSYHGYDVTDYYGVNADYGTLDDLKALLAAAHERGIKIIIDMVLNHTSAQHPWFKQALAGDPQYKEWYVWSDSDPGTRSPWGGQTWHRASTGQYYYGIFWDQMPDLNYQNPAVQAEAKQIAAYWLQEVGVDGFRLDGARYVVEEGKNVADTPSNHAFWKDWNTSVHSLNPAAFTIGEVWTSSRAVAQYLQAGEFDAAFNFDMSLDASPMRSVLGNGDGVIFNFLLTDLLKRFPQQNNANILTNHDMKRAASYAGGADPLGQGKLAAAVYLTLPGIPFVYYGEEIGMTGNKPDERLRTPMQWSAEPGAGFTTGTPWEMINADFKTINVAAQAGQPDSLLERYRQLITLRNTHPALTGGATSLVQADSKKVAAYLRQAPGETVLVVHNLDDQPTGAFTLTLAQGPLAGAYTAVDLLGGAPVTGPTASAAGGLEAYAPVTDLAPYQTLILQLTPAP